MCALLGTSKIPLEWADNQYWCTLTRIFNETAKMLAPKKKEKVTAQQMQSFIR